MRDALCGEVDIKSSDLQNCPSPRTHMTQEATTQYFCSHPIGPNVDHAQETGKECLFWMPTCPAKNINNQESNQKMDRRPKQTFLQRRHKMVNKDMKRCPTSLIIREMQIKSTMSYHLTLVTIAIIKKSTNNKYWRGCGEKNTLLHCWWECKLIQPLWRTI